MINLNRKSKLVLIVLLLITLSIQLYSQSDGGGYSSAYLQRNNGARPIGMAGAYTAISNDPSAIFYNPAGIGFLDDNALINSSMSFIGLGRIMSSLSWTQMVSDNIGLGAAFNSLYTGSFMGRDIKGNPTREMSEFQYGLNVALAYRLEFISMGANIKYLANNLSNGGVSANGFALDVGTKFDVFDLFSFGMSVQNISGMMFYNNSYSTISRSIRDDIPYIIRSGIAFEYALNDDEYTTRSTITGQEERIVIPATRYIIFSTDLVYHQHTTSPEFVIATEASLHELIALRGGISIYGDKFGSPQFFPMNHWGGGISLKPDLKDLPFRMNIDYSIANEYLTDNRIAHHISLILEF